MKFLEIFLSRLRNLPLIVLLLIVTILSVIIACLVTFVEPARRVFLEYGSYWILLIALGLLLLQASILKKKGMLFHIGREEAELSYFLLPLCLIALVSLFKSCVSLTTAKVLISSGFLFTVAHYALAWHKTRRQRYLLLFLINTAIVAALFWLCFLR